MHLSQVAEALNAKVSYNDSLNLNAMALDGVAINTREDCEGKLFVALKGENFDAHDYLEQAEKSGATAVLLEREAKSNLPSIVVDDTHIALKELAAWWRRQFAIPVIGITGSVGKTTVKEMVGAIFAELGQGVVTKGNLNNEIGLPLTVLRLSPIDRYAVIEMGMSNAGEIFRLSNIARPTIALVNNAAPAHLEDLGSVAAVAEAKGEIFSGLAEDGVAIINLDDEYSQRWIELAGKRRCLTFALDQKADVTAKIKTIEPQLQLKINALGKKFNVSLNAVGEHNARNALAAIAISIANGISVDKIVSGLSKFVPIKGRLNIQEVASRRLIDDTYNANPASMRAAINVLSEFEQNTLILGDMGELGATVREAHFELGEYAANHGVDQLIACGEYAQDVARGFAKKAQIFSKQADLIESLTKDGLGSTILVKGSRTARMELVVDAIKTLLDQKPSLGEG